VAAAIQRCAHGGEVAFDAVRAGGEQRLAEQEIAVRRAAFPRDGWAAVLVGDLCPPRGIVAVAAEDPLATRAVGLDVAAVVAGVAALEET
jgi:hypothetical protein